MTRYFISRTPHIRIYAGSGRILTFITKDAHVGWIASDDPDDCAALENAIKKHVGGDIEELTEAEYQQWEKKTNALPLFRREGEFSTERPVGDTIMEQRKPAPPKAPPVQSLPPAAAVEDPGSHPSTAPVIRKRGK